ncbi:class I SAM-dependent methyltransferase [Okeania hirsuta]|nr:class I SAM-dependent methyltransferase [Okeania hirsuta]
MGFIREVFHKKYLNLWNRKKLHLVDPWQYHQEEIYQKSWYGGKVGKNQQEMNTRYQLVTQMFADEIKSGQVEIHRDFSNNICQDFADNYFDWIYIDGNHLYEYVKQDLELYYGKVKTGGLITGDDYFQGGWWNGGVVKAVNEFVINYNLHVVLIQTGQYILQKL